MKASDYFASLVASFGVLPPEVVQTVTPTATKKP